MDRGPSPTSDLADVRRAKAGDPDAFARLVHRYARRVHDLARRMLRDAGEAEDVAQQAFLNAWRAMARFDPERPFRNWLLRITSNLCRNRYAARRRRPELRPRGGEDALPEVEAAPAGPETGGGGAPEVGGAARRALESLPEKYRLPMILHYVHRLPLAEISEIAGTPLPTVKTHLFRGRAALRELLAPDETDAAPGGTKE